MAAINPANQNKAIAEIYSQNPRIKDKVKIVQLRWSKKALNQGKTRSALHIGVASPEQANLLLSQGLLFESELHDCEVFEGECQVTQCFKCIEYGHIANSAKTSSNVDSVQQLVISPKIASKRMTETATTAQYAKSQEHDTQHGLENARSKKRW